MIVMHLPYSYRIFQRYVWSPPIRCCQRGHAWHGFACWSAASQQRVAFMLQYLVITTFPFASLLHSSVEDKMLRYEDDVEDQRHRTKTKFDRVAGNTAPVGLQ
jgi:hypothetical protein